MKAVYFNRTGNISNLEVGELPLNEPPLAKNEVRLEFLAGSLNHLDLWVLKGLPRVHYEFPHIAGADFCGRVVETKSSHFKVGDRVVVYPAEGVSSLAPDFKIRGENTKGVFRDFIHIKDSYVFSAPAHLSDIEAASIPLVYLTAWQMLVEKAELQPDETYEEPVLVHGAGSGVTQALLQLLLSFKVNKIAVTSRHASKLAGLDPKVSTFVQGPNAYEELKAWAGPDRASIIFDHVGEALFDMNIRLLRNGGKFITCGATSGFQANLDLRQLYFRQLQLLGSTMGSLKAFKHMLAWVSQAQLRPTISHRFLWSQIQEAYSVLASGGQTGKIVVSKTDPRTEILADRKSLHS